MCLLNYMSFDFNIKNIGVTNGQYVTVTCTRKLLTSLKKNNMPNYSKYC